MSCALQKIRYTGGMKKVLISAGLLLIPHSVLAAASIQVMLADSISFINGTIIPLLFSLAFLFFLINIIRYFIMGGGNEDSREKARSFALWGLVAFVVMVSLWGIVNILTNSLGIDDHSSPVCPDFLPPGYCSGGPIT